jgi:hypothetical protein
MSCRKPCKECPWKNDNNHNLKFRTYVDKFDKLGKPNHKCHMIDGDIWSVKSEVSDKNICIGSKQRSKN